MIPMAMATCRTMSEGLQSPVFVGRRDEVASLAAMLDRAAEGQPGFAIIAGEAGVGKTRLVGEVAGHAAGAGFSVLTGHCVELGAEGLPLAPLIDALRALARTTPPGELAEVLGPARRGLGRLLSELDPGALLAQNPGAEAAADGIQPAQLLELVLGLLGRLSARRPLMLVLEPENGQHARFQHPGQAGRGQPGRGGGRGPSPRRNRLRGTPGLIGHPFGKNKRTNRTGYGGAPMRGPAPGTR